MADYGFLLNTLLLGFLIYYVYRFHTLVNNHERAILATDHNDKLRFLTYASRKMLDDLYRSLDLSTLTGCAKMYLREDGVFDNLDMIMKRFVKEHNAIIDKLSEGIPSDNMKIASVTVQENRETKEIAITLAYSTKYHDVLVFHTNHLAQAIYQLDRLCHRLSTFSLAVPRRDMYQL